MKYPGIWTIQNLIESAQTCSAGLPDGRYVPARPMGFQSWRERWRAAWLVWTGRADAVTWEQQ